MQTEITAALYGEDMSSYVQVLKKPPKKSAQKFKFIANASETIDSSGLFFKQLNHTLLSAVQEIRYLRLAQQGELQARDKMIVYNQRLVLKIAKRYQNYGLELVDLIQEGTIGLMTAIKKFDFNKETRFSTYAGYWIEHALNRAITSKGRAIRLPVHVAQAVNKVQKILKQCRK